MAGWIRGRIRMRFRSFCGFANDIVALGRARTKGRFANLHVALIAATSHEEAPGNERYLQLLLSAGTGSRMHMSYCIRLLMDRLNKAKNWVVALKCLTLIHKGLQTDKFIFQDQVSFWPAQGGRNYLNLSNFKDNSSPVAWEASSWIRWYARYLEQRILTCRTLGYFWGSKWSHSELIEEKVCSLENDVLVRELVTLNDLLQEIRGCPNYGSSASNELIEDALRLVILDSFRTQEELKIRLREVCQRLDVLTNSDVSRCVQVCETLTMDSISSIHLTEICLAKNLLQSHQCPEIMSS